MTYDPSQKEVDFSHFFDKDNKQKPNPALQIFETKPGYRPSRIVILLSILLVLAVIQIGLLIYSNFRQPSGPTAPPGYRIETPPNEPPRLEKN